MILSQPEFNYIRRLVQDQSAIVLEEDKGYLVEARLLPLARREGFGSIGLLVQKLQAERFNGLHRRVVEAMTTNETSFFRDFSPFEALKKFVLPELIAARASERAFSVWCAASSSGQPITLSLPSSVAAADAGSQPTKSKAICQLSLQSSGYPFKVSLLRAASKSGPGVLPAYKNPQIHAGRR